MTTINRTATSSKNLVDYDAVVKALQFYIEGSIAGKSEMMRPGIHADANIVGYAGENLLFGPIQILYDWIDGNGPAPDIEPNFASIEILETIAVVRLEIKGWSGKLAGSDVHMSDIFNLVKIGEEWKISQKMFHWHT